ncbi:MAG: DMT family transporter [Candidatus Rokubacteria bacterium]|nr:DMT family transporter [Candidatus Rokubacteria bacterium]
MADLTGPAFGAVCALLSALIWTLIGVSARALAPYFSALSINMLRSALGGLLLTAVVLPWGGLGGLGGVSTRAWLYLGVSVLTAFAIGDTAFFESTKTIGLARAMTVSMVYPLIASGLGVWLVGERITAPVVAGAMVTLAGLALIVSERGPAAVLQAGERQGRGLGLALLAATAWGVSPVLMTPAIADIDPVSVQAVRLPFAALVLWVTPWARGTGRQVRVHFRAAGPLLLAIGVLTALSAVSWVAGLKYAGITLTTVLSSTSPLFAIPIGLAVFGERVSARAVAGTLLCLAGIALLSF